MSSVVAFAMSALIVGLSPCLLRGYWQCLSLLPSTLLHELSHYVLAHATGSQPTPMDLVPRKTVQGWTLGAVSFVPRPWTAAFVALAPLSLMGVAYALLMTAGQNSLEWELVKGAAFASALQGSIPSRTDWRVAASYPLGLIVVGSITGVCLHFVQIL
jgi:hypothetical protein